MIIMSQDKYNILNFDTTVNIGVEEITTLSDIVRISAQTNGNTIILGEYKTAERAKEVLDEIGNAYAVTQMLLCPTLTISTVLKGKDVAEVIFYKMPAE